MKKRNIIIIVIGITVLAVIAYGIYYVNDYYHADEVARSYLTNSSDVKLINTSNGLLIDGYGDDTAMIFYPGAKVEYTSYLPMLNRVAEKGIDVYLVEMPFNIAFLAQNSADEIIENGNYTHYYIAGHSLGGVVASSYVNQTNSTDGLILLASYPTCEIRKPVLSIYGSEDEVFNMDSYNDSKTLMNNLTEIIISGGNHAQFANYGKQTGDGLSEISSNNQQSQTADAIADFIL